MAAIQTSGKMGPVYATLLESIRDNQWRTGARINPIGIASQLGVSVTPVREALQRLASERLVEFERSRGYYIRPFQAKAVKDCYETALALLIFVVLRMDTRLALNMAAVLERECPEPERARNACRTEYARRFADWLELLSIRIVRSSRNDNFVDIMRVCHDRVHVITVLDSIDASECRRVSRLVREGIGMLRAGARDDLIALMEGYFRRRERRLPKLVQLAAEQARQAPLP